MKSAFAVKQLKKIQKLIHKKDLRLAAEWNSKYKILIATILSAQTRDETTIDVCENLFKKYPSMTRLSKARVNSIEKYYDEENKNMAIPFKSPEPRHHFTVENEKNELNFF